MPLVAYSDDSDDSDEETSKVETKEVKPESSSVTDVNRQLIPSVATNCSSDLSANSNNHDVQGQNIHLPVPKTKVVSTSLIDLVIKKDSKGSLRILLPSSTTEDLDDEETEEEAAQRRKRLKLKESHAGSSLLSLLPPVKQSATSRFIPHSVSKKFSASSVKDIVKPTTKSSSETKPFVDKHNANDDDGDEDTIGQNFFSFPSSSSTAIEEPCSSVENMSNFSSDDLDAQPFVGPQPSLENNAISSASPNDRMLKRIIAEKFGEENPDAIQVVDIKANYGTDVNRDYLKTISLETPEEFKGVLPSSTAKRKHQITFLAYQAKQRELQLKNEWSASKLTKSQSRSKYGF